MKKRIFCALLTLALCLGLLPTGTALAAGAHIMSEDNNWNISGELIAPGESFTTREKLNETIRSNPGLADTKLIHHENAELRLDDMETDTSHLIRSTANIGLITASSTNVLDTFEENNNAGTKTVTTGYTNNTGLPFTIAFMMESGENLGDAWLFGEQGQKIQTLTEIRMTYKSAPSITFYEPYYLVSYEGLEDGEEQGLPDRIYVDNATHTFRLPILEREGQTFDGWFGLYYYLGDGVESGGYITYTYDWEQLHNYFEFQDITISPSFSGGSSSGSGSSGGSGNGSDNGSGNDYTEGWSFDSATGRLTIYSDEGIENWYQTHWEEYDAAVADGYQDQSFLGTIRSVVLEEGVTRIDHGIFEGCTKLSSVRLPSTLEYIEDAGFAYCGSLTALNFPNPNGVTFGNNAFEGCTALRDVTFGTTDAEYPFTAYDGDELFRCTNPNLKIHVGKAVEQAVKELLPSCADRVNTTDTTEYYGLVVNGEHISDKHLTVQCGSGTAVYDPETGTLTLDNATITKSDPDGAFWWSYPEAYNEEDIWHPLNGKVGIFTMLPDLKIILNGANVITDMGAHTALRADGTVEDIAHAIFNENGNIHISGNGSLDYQDANNDSAVTEIYCDTYDPSRRDSIVIDGSTLKGKYRLETASRNSVVVKNAALEDAAISSGGDLAISDSTVNCSRDTGRVQPIAVEGSTTLNYSHITLDGPLSSNQLSINGGYLKVSVEGMGIYTAPVGTELENIHLGANTKVTQGSFDRSHITHEVLIVEGTTDGATAPAITRQEIPATGTAYASTQTVEVDGVKIELPAYALLNEKGYPTNYVRVRDLAMLLNGTAGQYDVDYNKTDGVVLTSHHTYEVFHRNGTEGNIPFTGNQPYKSYLADTLVDGTWQPLTAYQITYENGGHTYYQLRDLGKALGFNVGWTSERGMFIETNKPYTDAD